MPRASSRSPNRAPGRSILRSGPCPPPNRCPAAALLPSLRAREPEAGANRRPLRVPDPRLRRQPGPLLRRPSLILKKEQLRQNLKKKPFRRPALRPILRRVRLPRSGLRRNPTPRRRPNLKVVRLRQPRSRKPLPRRSPRTKPSLLPSPLTRTRSLRRKNRKRSPNNLNPNNHKPNNHNPNNHKPWVPHPLRRSCAKGGKPQEWLVLKGTGFSPYISLH
jgi:hypothetical protein